MQLAAIIQLALALLPLVEEGVEEFIAWIKSLRDAAIQSGEWTPQQQEAFRAALFAKTQDSAYLPDP